MSDPRPDCGMEEIIFEVLGEGGGVKLIGRRQPEGTGWEYRRQAREMSYAMDDPEDDDASKAAPAPRTVEARPKPSEPVWVSTWAEAMGLMDRNPWAMLHPREVHPEFQADVLVEATKRLTERPPIGASRALDRWLKICSQTRFRTPR